MRTCTVFASLSLVTLLTACGMPDNGYYDNNGNYIPPRNTTTEAQRIRPPHPGNSDDYGHRHRTSGQAVVVVPPGHAYHYDRRGYYDYNGYFVTVDDRYMSVPQDMFPPRGMCRVWIPNRAPESQPGIESCNGIHGRVPAGAYVIYGG